jgi:hypothetical protein
MKPATGTLWLCALLLPALPAHAEDGGDFLGFELSGSLREGGFERYVPPVTNPAFNETPFITTEAKPLYVYHDIPDDFISGGGNVQVGALQLRLAFTERLGLIATLDGYTAIDFNDVLEDDDGPNDIAFGLKYAFVHDVANGIIGTAGLRYTAPAGNLETSGIELNGTGAGYLNPFVTGAYLFGDAQLQGSMGVQVALSEDNWSFFHASVHGDYEVFDSFFPFVEANVFAPIDGGDAIGGPLSNLTGADIVDIGAEDPVTIFTIGGGARYRLTDWAIFGAGVEGNLTNREDTVFGWRVTTDFTLHF